MMEGKHRKKKMEEPKERSLYGKMEDNSPERNSLSDYGTMRIKPGDQKRMNMTLPSNGKNIPFVSYLIIKCVRINLICVRKGRFEVYSQTIRRHWIQKKIFLRKEIILILK